MKNVIKLTESDLTKIVNRVIIEQESNDLPRKTYTHKINKIKLQGYKNKGLSLYYFNPTEGKDFGLVEFTEPVDRAPWTDSSNRVVFALTPEQYEKVNKAVDNVKELISQYYKMIELYKQHIPAIMNELVSKK